MAINGSPALLVARNPFERDTGAAALTLNVKDFGARGDGATDDTLAIQAAINATANLRATLYIPHGRYVVSPQGSNNYALLVPRGFTPNGALGTIVIRGDGASSLLLNVGSNNIGTTIYMASTANKPVFRIAGARSVAFHDINIQGTNKAVVGSVAVSVYDFNSDVQFHACGFNGFECGVNLGDPNLPDGGSHNNDMVTFLVCKWTNLTNAITCYGFNTYGCWDFIGYYGTNVENVFKYFPEPSGSQVSNQDFKFVGSQFLNSGSIIWSAGSCKVRLGVVELVSCTIEPVNADAFMRIHRQDDLFAGNAHGFRMIGCTINMNGTSNTTLTTPVIEYGGRGPLLLEGNRVDSYHFEILLNTDQNTINAAAAKIGTNQWLTKPIIRRPIGSPYPAVIHESGHFTALPRRNLTDNPVITSADSSRFYTNGGVGTYFHLSTDTGSTIRKGSIVLDLAALKRCSVSGTYGNLVGVTGSIDVNTNTLTLTGGDPSTQRAKIHGGTIITIAGVLGGPGGDGIEVDKIVGDVVTLHANADASVVGAAVQFKAPTVA